MAEISEFETALGAFAVMLTTEKRSVLSVFARTRVANGARSTEEAFVDAVLSVMRKG
mgnify:CR=1 FL=1